MVAFLHRVVLGHGDNVLGTIHHKGHRFVIQNIPPGTLLFIQLVISKAQGLRQHEGPVESVTKVSISMGLG